MSNEKAPQIAPVLPDQWQGAVLDAVGAFPSSRDYVLSKWPGEIANGANGLGTMLNHPALAKAFLVFNHHVSVGSTLSKRVREILILRIGWLRKAEYEWLQHVITGKRAGLTDADIERITIGPDAPGWDAVDADLVRAVDELFSRACIQPATWTRLTSVFNPQQMIDLIFCVGCYEVLAMAFNSWGVACEASLAPMEPDLRARMLAQSPR
jgi:4-carboxymuconolactone decarboxylase